jgi:hypothetical protein
MQKTRPSSISFYDKFYRLATTPLGFVELEVFYDDLAELVEEHRPENMPLKEQP